MDSRARPRACRTSPPVLLLMSACAALLQGAGKTTTVAKFAHYYQRKGWRVAMVCADTFRAGAFDQLKQNATKLRCPFYGSYTEADPVRIADEGVQHFKEERYEVIIVDTSGRHKQEDALFEEMQEIQAAVEPDNVVLVMDATQGQGVSDQAKAFHSAVAVGSVIITKLDGHAKGGGALSAVAATGSPIVFLGSGERFDDLEVFAASSFVGRLLGFGDIGTLMKEIKDAQGSEADVKKARERMIKGKFTLRDMYQQFQTVMKMGPLNKMMGMMPGMPQNIMDMGMQEDGQKQMKHCLYIMDSMTDDELDGKVDVNTESRIRRLARGSGRLEEEVRALLYQHKQSERVISKMGKSGMLGKGGAAGPMGMGDPKAAMQAMQRNPGAMSKMLSPEMMKMMGGQQGLQKMMEQMGGGGPGGMPDMGMMAEMMRKGGASGGR
jgi:signal recognition particle subunit SRP54